MRLRGAVEWLHMRSRRTKRIMLLLADVVGLMAIIWLAFCFRFNRFFVPNFEQTLFILAAPAIAIPIFIRMGLYRAVLRYLQERAIWTMIRAVTFATLAWVGLVFITLSYGAEGVPRTIAVLYWAGSLVGVIGSRLGIKWLLNGSIANPAKRSRVLIYGAGDAAVQLADALSASGDRHVVGIVSDDSSLHGMEIVGIRVYPSTKLEELLADTEAQEVIIAASSSSTRRRRDLVARLGRFPVKIRVLPSIADVAAGKYLVSYVRDIDIDDLLGRSPVPADPALMQSSVEGKVIMVTGAAGSIGSAVCRTVAQANPAKLVLFEMNELGLYEIERELRRYGSFPVVPVLGSICDARLVRHTLCEQEVHTVYHCAAYKHVPLVEGNPLEGVRNNVFGTLTLAEEACASDVRNFILISSDKAVRPSSVMGATKRWAELIVRHYGTEACRRNEGRVFSSVRFGNVIGSSGSVVPLFKEQISAGGPVTLTHEEMTRYFMSVREAAELIVQAGALSRSGDILLLDMGEPIKIRQLAEDMIMLAGFSVRNEDNPDGDIEVVTIGVRDGEKLHEELFYDPSGVSTTRHPKILRAAQQLGKTDQIPAMVAQLKLALEHGDVAAMRQVLFGLIESGRPSAVPDLSALSSGKDLRRRA
ncbi:nucleoside-diphosphate sugar epimerase/dehydratase [Chelativorans sp. AA-79]|uniref:polysaccharide biosynthesis protein n=1 Tax=Chelativorans sp. AA-79 TaxID=3028735 RepID=UPI0023F79FF6|nr:nucleoside-diphosphate sugar epimerase/dehydratase [Chelativorans sp. AA-79]WEX07798.1 nucleoside-diphosphate sugar epimerase/dehydratase [Chelativorans sp. AA-79]